MAERYGQPQHDLVIEAFAGSASYSTFWEPKKVLLIEKDPVIAGIWKYLTKVSGRELMRLPSNISHIDELPARVCPEARSLIGFWFNHGVQSPGVSRANWAKTPRYAAFYWSETIKSRLARQVEKIRHWKIIEGDYTQASDVNAHWFVDPPYNNEAGQAYRYHEVDYRALAKWVRSRKGFVQVCENDGATWLPFQPFMILPTLRKSGFTAEAVFECENT